MKKKGLAHEDFRTVSVSIRLVGYFGATQEGFKILESNSSILGVVVDFFNQMENNIEALVVDSTLQGLTLLLSSDYPNTQFYWYKLISIKFK
jgi:hypothetical protein